MKKKSLKTLLLKKYFILEKRDTKVLAGLFIFNTEHNSSVNVCKREKYIFIIINANILTKHNIYY